MVLVQKWPFFQLFFGGNIGQENVFNDFLERKSAFLSYKKEKFKKFKNSNFFKGVNQWFWSKNGHFCNLFFQAIKARKMSFTTFQNDKSPFQAIKTRSSNSRKIDIFPKVLTHGFGPIMAIFRHVSFFAIWARKMSVTIFQNEKTPVQAIKTRSSNSRKIGSISKGLTHGFGPKIAVFATFFLRQ